MLLLEAAWTNPQAESLANLPYVEERIKTSYRSVYLVQASRNKYKVNFRQLESDKDYLKAYPNFKRNWIAQLEKAFKAEEIKYLHSLFSHGILTRFDRFVATATNDKEINNVLEAHFKAKVASGKK